MMWAHGWLNRQARDVMSSRRLSTARLALPIDRACAAHSIMFARAICWSSGSSIGSGARWRA